MGSPILEYIYENTGIDAIYLLGVMMILIIVLMIISIIMLCKLKKLYRAYDRFMRGKDAESLEDTLMNCIAKTEEVDQMNQMLREDIIGLRKNQRITYQKMGMVKYDAFREMSGKLSYALALLDQQNNGFVINSVYAKEGGYSYIKEIVNGECAILLSEDEQKALEKAKSRT
jgi:biopolymer transport protein ExbB/TolQ